MKIVLSFLLLFLAFNSYASALEELPFGIKIGETRNSEIDKRGTCIRKVELTGYGRFRCAMYSMQGKFVLESSQSEVVSKLRFDNGCAHKLPRAWRGLGIKLQCKTGDEGTSYKHFLKIIEAEGAQYIDIVSEGGVDFELEFEVGNLLYTARFWKKASPYGNWKKGLSSLIITEAY